MANNVIEKIDTPLKSVLNNDSVLSSTELRLLSEKQYQSLRNQKVQNLLIKEIEETDIMYKMQDYVSNPDRMSSEDISLIQLYVSLKSQKSLTCSWISIDWKESIELKDAIIKLFPNINSSYFSKTLSWIESKNEKTVENKDLKTYLKENYWNKIWNSEKELDSIISQLSFLYIKDWKVSKSLLNNMFSVIDGNSNKITNYLKSISVLLTTYSYSDNINKDYEKILQDSAVLNHIYSNPNIYWFLSSQFDKYWNLSLSSFNYDINTTFSTFSYDFFKKLLVKRKSEVLNDNVVWKRLIELYFEKKDITIYNDLANYLYKWDFKLNFWWNPSETINKINETLNTPDSPKDIVFRLMKYIKGSEWKNFILSYLKIRCKVTKEHTLYKYIDKKFDHIEKYLEHMNFWTFQFLDRLLESIKTKDKNKIKAALRGSLEWKNNFILQDNKKLLQGIFDDFDLFHKTDFSEEDKQEIKTYYKFFIESKSVVENEMIVSYVPMIKSNVKELIKRIIDENPNIDNKSKLAIEAKFQTLFSGPFITSVEAVVKKIMNGQVNYSDFTRFLAIELNHAVVAEVRKSPKDLDKKTVDLFINSLLEYQENPEKLEKIILTVWDKNLNITKTKEYLSTYDKLDLTKQAQLNKLDARLQHSVIKNLYLNNPKNSQIQNIKLDYLKKTLNYELANLSKDKKTDYTQLFNDYKEIFAVIDDKNLDYDVIINKVTQLINKRPIKNIETSQWIGTILSVVDSKSDLIKEILSGLKKDEKVVEKVEEWKKKIEVQTRGLEKFVEHTKTQEFKSDISSNFGEVVSSVSKNVDTFYKTHYPSLLKEYVWEKLSSDVTTKSSESKSFSSSKLDIKETESNFSYGLTKADFGMYSIPNPFYDQKNQQTSPTIVWKLDTSFKYSFIKQYLFWLGINIQSLKFTSDDLIDKLWIDIMEPINEQNFDSYFKDVHFKLDRFLWKYVNEVLKKDIDSLPSSTPSQIWFKEAVKDAKNEIVDDFYYKRYPKNWLKNFFNLIKWKEQSLFSWLYEFLSKIDKFDLSSLPKDYADDLNEWLGSLYYFNIEKWKLSQK